MNRLGYSILSALWNTHFCVFTSQTLYQIKNTTWNNVPDAIHCILLRSVETDLLPKEEKVIF